MVGGGAAALLPLVLFFVSIIQFGVWIYLGSTDKIYRFKIACLEAFIFILFSFSLAGYGPDLFLLVSLLLIGPLILVMLLTPLIYRLTYGKKAHNKFK